MTGLVGNKVMAHSEECIPLAAEHLRLLESIGDPELTVGLQIATFAAKSQAGEGVELLELAERVISLADGDATKGNMIYGSPLAMAHTFRATARWCLGLPGWKDDFDRGIAMARDADVATLAGVMFYTYVVAVPWILPADEAALRDTADALERAERSGDDVAVIMSRTARGNVLVAAGGDASEAGLALLAQVKTDILHERFSHSMLGAIDTITAEMMTKAGDLDGAIALLDAVFDNNLWNSGEGMWALTTGVLVDALLAARRGWRRRTRRSGRRPDGGIADRQHDRHGDARAADARRDRAGQGRRKGLPCAGGRIPGEGDVIRLPRARRCRARDDLIGPCRLGVPTARLWEYLPVNAEDDPEARIRALEQPLSDQARASELGGGQAGGDAAYLPPPTSPYSPPDYSTQHTAPSLTGISPTAPSPTALSSPMAGSPTKASSTAPSRTERPTALLRRRSRAASRGWCSV